ncbi:winged helix-turn-helix domain-containing protein [Chloroflexus sp.]|uniref:winged helix-turn-helix domain-containing protein n=1 Tax=Chloroflexus sp. TaxID=1904827 RepID=UPI002ADE2DB3|nr:winged helix-turn-helix domain-containing protein [Chloroflexus sp.]
MQRGVALLLEPDHTRRINLIHTLHQWYWAVLSVSDLDRATHFAQHCVVPLCILHLSDLGYISATLSRFLATVSADQTVIMLVDDAPAPLHPPPSVAQVLWLPTTPMAITPDTTILATVRELAYRLDLVPAPYQHPPRFRLDPIQKRVQLDDQVISLSESELTILDYLYQAHGRICTFLELAQLLYPRLHVYDTDELRRLIGSRMQRLRRKLEADPATPRYLHLVRGVGFRLVIAPLEPAGSRQVESMVTGEAMHDGAIPEPQVAS